ncbi:MAG TPA: 50S ribosomal protein L6 [Bacteroidia bacterium]|nr:MAG: 50S ribosomal protein L6 [Bacteroidetes bacterium OLB10]MBE7509294.1 50S ribosomal protein L6 [Bacteroidia bacterium]MBX3106381.1 50S ribosomal protein L6 [Bacteroidota bacterium]MCE7954215.1 50S ribosomal protein L6 [Bacteroidetes bacterium CHB6]OQB64373.1 MAG: 50S ribosomal protein L6 [Bacteroidetes bacterium ADurb.Bin141]
MSRIGKLPIALPSGIQVSVADNVVTVKGPKGTLTQAISEGVTVEVDGGQVVVKRASDEKQHKALHGLYRALINNMVKGVSQGYKIEQELVGVGYRASHQGQQLDLVLGHSHHVVFQLPSEIKVNTKTERGSNPTIILESHDKQLIGQVAAKIRSLRKPEPYKGKGIKFTGEVLRRKAGKSAAKK